jgi:hypothetical protein
MSNKSVKIIKVENKLKQKTGFGEISETVIATSEVVLQNNQVDFKEIATPILQKLRAAIKKAQTEPENIESISKTLVDCVMELKANGPMFKYQLVGNLASIMLSFLEHIHTFDKDAIEIIGAHEKTLSAIVDKGIKGDGGPMGTQVQSELEGACGRYYRKNPEKFKTAPSKP